MFLQILDNVSGKVALNNYMVFVVVLLGTTLLLYRKIKKENRLPPGPIGLPLIGYLPFLGKEPHKTLAKLGEKYGNIMSIRFGHELTIVLNDITMMRQVLCHPSALGRDSRVFEVIPETGFGGSCGKEWEEQRRFCMQSMRDLGMGRGRWENMIQDAVPDFLDILRSKKGEPFDERRELLLALCGLSLSLLIGRKLVDEDKVELGADFLDVALNFSEPSNLGSVIPALRKYFEFFKIAGYDKLAKVVKQFRTEISIKAIETHKTNPEFLDVHDFINLYLNKMKSPDAKYFTDGNAEGNFTALFVGAGDTVTASLGWLFRLMAGYPEIQRRVQEELDDVIGQDGNLSYEDRFKVPYTIAVAMEAQRFSAIAPFPAPRRALDDIEVNGFVIPKGTSILTNNWAITRDPNHWNEPHLFKPERFLSEDKKKVLTNIPSFVPFSVGRRNCPGETVAWMLILNFFTSVLQNFNISTPAGEKANLGGMRSLVVYVQPQALRYLSRNK